MKRPYLSVCMPTMRSGGLDVVMNGLARQRLHPDEFELVIADGLYERRRRIVAEMTARSRFRVTHVEPIGGSPFPRNDFCRYANTALVHARGEVVVFITDYTWLGPYGLLTHAEFHRSHHPERGLMCPHQYVTLPEPHQYFPRYEECRTGKDTERYADDVAAGRHDAFMWSAFDAPWSVDGFMRNWEAWPPALSHDPVWANADPKLTLPAGPVLPSYFHAKNESVPLESLLAVNGWNEALDGTHGWQDTDLADRLTHREGLEWTVDPANVAWIVNPRHHFPIARRSKDYRINEKIWQDAKIDGHPIPNTWDLRQVRQMLGIE